MRIGRTLPPAAAPLSLKEVISGVAALFDGERAIERFEAELKQYYAVPYVFLLSSGQAALAVILTALKQARPGRDEVIIPAYTCYSVPAAVVRAGLRVRPCDIDPRTLDFDWERLEEALKGERVLCAVATHLFGVPADVGRLKALASRHGVAVVEDAAQAMGGEVAGSKVGTLGDVALFSLGRGKGLCTVSGGIILAGSGPLGRAIEHDVSTLPREGWTDALKALCYALALMVLVRPSLFWLPKGLPFLGLGETVFDPGFVMKRLGTFQAGLARGWREKIARLRDTRLRHAAFLEQAGVAAAVSFKGALPDLVRFPVLAEDPEMRKWLIEKSEEQGLGVTGGYPEAVTRIRELQGALAEGAAPQAEQVARRIVSLPVHPLVTQRDLERIAALFRGGNGQ
ncbi:aminotransferase class V-fold PLP-dependent enzyme [Geomonas azotofigens]|uniref:aminotransferase class V-fold PLP-dependent enzyme n=1 Tax=Geomonas azotofigens TaxID=2843196 RepID=UPI001C10C2C3|nr:aminotransferase class V-fold PLP-dependent enzyme [Geomonas azotofigens]MBU5613490.1 aminotransferase class V-fold PLP-dependent enzyme [Geomonas azotofigens]